MADKTLLSCRCANCGAPLEIQPWDEFVKCQYCETVFKVEKTKNEEIVINNIQNITVEKKGFAQSAFEYLDKRAEARERAEAEERARKAEAEARKRKIWLKIGEFFLWSCFFPIMLIVTLVKNANEKKENERLIERGLPPKNITPMPTVLMIIGGVMFISAMGSGLSENRGSYSSVSTNTLSPTITEIPSVTPAVTGNSQTNWYEQEAFFIKNTTFPEDVETVDKTISDFKYTVPANWRERETDEGNTYYPVEGTNNTFLYISTADLSTLNLSALEGYSEDQINTFLYNEAFKIYLNNEEYKNCSATPCVLNNHKGIMITCEYVNNDFNVSGGYIDTTFITNNTKISCVAMMANGENNISIEDYVATLNSIQQIE